MMTVNIHQSKIAVVKFNGTNNFDMYRCEVMDTLTALNVKDSLLYDKNNIRISRRKIGTR